MATSRVISASGADYTPLTDEGQESIHETPALTIRSSISDLTKRNTPKRTYRKDILNDSWLWEILCTSLSVLCLVALAVLLKVFDKQPLPQLSYGVTFNSIISILVTVSRTSLGVATAAGISQLKWHWYLRERCTTGKSMLDIQLYDDASRGPWGSLVFLFTPHAWSWASIGAIATIITLTLDPFAQQLARYPLRDFPIPSNTDSRPPVIPRAETLFAGDNFIENQEFLYRDLLAAITSSVWTDSSPESYVSKSVCASDTCTWDEVDSLAFCSVCEDKTRVWHLDGCRLQFDFTNEGLFPDIYPLDKRDMAYEEKRLIPVNKCTIITTEHKSADLYDIERIAEEQEKLQLMDGMNLTHQYRQPLNISIILHLEDKRERVYPSKLMYAEQAIWLVDGNYADTYARRQAAGLETGAGNGSALPLLSMGSVQLQYDPAIRSDGLSIKAASLCTLTPCVKKYQVKIQNGTVTTQVHDTKYGEFYYDPTATGIYDRIQPYMDFTFANWRPYSNWSLEDSGAGNLAHASAGPPNSSYHLDWDSMYAIGFLMRDTFAGMMRNIVTKEWPDLKNTTNITLFADFDQDDASQILNEAARYDDSTLEYDSNAILGQIVQKGGLEWVMPRMADSLSRMMRDRSGLNVPGQAFVSKQSVEVRWEWIILPIIAVASGIVFLALTMYICRGPDYILWKSSSLPLLYHNMERWDIIQDVHSSSHDVDRVGGMERLARNTVTRLRRDEIDGELRFVRMEQVSRRATDE